MKWFYRCTNCGNWLSVNWEDKDNCYICRHCSFQHIPPLPQEQHDAFVDDRTPPEEMEADVYQLKGKLCTVPGCLKRADTLDHRIPWEINKRGTSIENLFPMCAAHNASKGDREYGEWLQERIVRHIK